MTAPTLSAPALLAPGHDVAPRAARRHHAGPPVTVAFVHRGHDNIAGSEQCLLDLVQHLDRARFRPIVICTAPTLEGAAAALGAPTYRFPDWGIGAAAPAEARRVMREVFERERPGLVHANMTAPIPILLAPARRLRAPIVAHLHLPLHDEYGRLHELIHQSSAAVGVAHHVVGPLEADGMARERLRVIHNAVDLARMDAGDASGLRAALGIPGSAFVAVSLGSLILRKGHDVTLRAVARARATGADVRLLICGTGGDEARFRALTDELGLAEVVHFLGHRRDVGAILRDAADVCVASAREEALPLNVLEAQCVGVPIVVSDIPAHHEALQPGTRPPVPVEDAAALADALLAVRADVARRASAAAIRDAARARFSMERYVSAFEGLYEELLARPRSSYGWLRGTHWPPAYTAWVGRVVRRRLGLAVRAGGTG